MADIKSAPSRQITGSSDGRTHDAIHVKQSPPPHLYQPRTSVSSSPASEVLSSSRSPSFTSTGTVPAAATSVSSPVTLGATTKTARSTTKRHPTTSTKDTSTAMTTVSSPSIKEGTTPTQRISRAKKGKRVHACNHPSCDKVFTRAEHLRRHQLNHNTDVLYKCEMCERTFVRQDLLSRHTERHATQAMKAVQTLALARNTGFAARYGINGISGMSTRPAPTSDYGGNAHVFDSNPHSTPRVHTDMNALPQILTAHSPHQSTPSTSSLVTPHSSNSMTSYASSFSPSMSISNSPISPTAQ